jgi:hypothetical protein
MADTLESIYLNTAIGATEMDDGEHTILTTNSTTRYVIKDMYVNGTSSLTGTYLELNGFNVGGISSNATGSLIIPPNSTLKIKTTDYPIQFYRNTEYSINGTELMFKESYEDGNGNATGTPFETIHTGINRENEVTDVIRVTASNNADFIIYSTSDNNSVQQAYYIQDSNGSKNQFDYRNYSPFMFDDNKVYTNGANASFEYRDLTTGSFGSVTTNFTPTGAYPSGYGNSYNPHPTSSYPRGRGAHGFIWFVPNSGYNQNLYAINTANGCFHSFNFGSQAHTMTSNNGNFVPSVDWENDKLYIYFNAGNQTQTIQGIYDGWSSIVALNNTSNPNNHTGTISITNSHTTNAGNHYSSSTMSRAIYGYDAQGGFTYLNTSMHRVSVDKDFSVTATDQSFTVSGTTRVAPNYAFVKKQDKLTQAQATALSLSGQQFGIQLLGIKSEG